MQRQGKIHHAVICHRRIIITDHCQGQMSTEVAWAVDLLYSCRSREWSLAVWS